MEYICSAVQRTLQFGVRHGFLVKRKEKYCLSGRKCETDSGIRTRTFDTASHAHCESLHKECVGTEMNRCSAMDLLTLDQCHRKNVSELNTMCTVHTHLQDLFCYRFLFSQYIKVGTWSRTSTMSDRIQKINEFTLQKYLAFFSKYFDYIFHYHKVTVEDRILIRKVLNRSTCLDTPCIGMNLETGDQCNAAARAGHACWEHHQFLSIMKCFSHCEISGGEMEHEYLDGFNFQNELIHNLEKKNRLPYPGLRERLASVPLCIRKYLAFIVRLECVMISPSVRTDEFL